MRFVGKGKSGLELLLLDMLRNPPPLSESQGKVLSHIALNGEKGMYDIHKDTEIKLTTVQAAIKKLVQKDLIAIYKEEIGAKGHMKKIYRLTPQGLSKVIQNCCGEGGLNPEDINTIMQNYKDCGSLIIKYWDTLVHENPFGGWSALSFLLLQSTFFAGHWQEPHFTSDYDWNFLQDIAVRLSRSPDWEGIANTIIAIPELNEIFQEVLNAQMVWHQEQIGVLSKYTS